MPVQQENGWAASAMAEVDHGAGGFDLTVRECLEHRAVVLQFSPQRQFSLT
jgi:hypothetical protein